MEKQKNYQKFIKFIASGFGIGFIPLMPGTWTSLAIVLIYWFWNPQGNAWVFFTLITVAIAIMISRPAETYFKKKDDQRITIDEIAGMALALIFIPHNLWLILATFILFRIFDISKILFIKKIEKQPGAWGLVGDDIIAGIYTRLIMYLIIYFLFI